MTLEFLKTIIQYEIDKSRPSLEVFEKNIKDLSEKLGVESKWYEKLPEIRTPEDFGEWVAYGHVLEHKLRDQEMKINNYSKSLARNYLQMASTLKYVPLNERAIGVAEEYLRHEKK
jgi:hypothetical protein